MTRRSVMAALYAELDGEDAFNPVKGVKRPVEPKPEPDPRPLEMIIPVLDQLWVRAAMNNRGWKTLARALVLAHTGMRPSQLMRLDPDLHIRSYIRGDRPVVRIPGGKGGKATEEPLTSGGVAAFLLFLRVGAEGKFSTSSFYKSWMLACDQAKVSRFYPYKLKHSFGTLARRNGADLADVQQLFGHTSAKTTARYADIVPEKLFAVADRIENAWDRACRDLDARGQTAWARPQVTETKAASDK